MLGGRLAVAVNSKPPASPPEVSLFDHLPNTFNTHTYFFSRLPGKAPRKQLATKAARKTAVVSVAAPLLTLGDSSRDCG